MSLSYRILNRDQADVLLQEFVTRVPAYPISVDQFEDKTVFIEISPLDVLFCLCDCGHFAKMTWMSSPTILNAKEEAFLKTAIKEVGKTHFDSKPFGGVYCKKCPYLVEHPSVHNNMMAWLKDLWGDGTVELAKPARS